MTKQALGRRVKVAEKLLKGLERAWLASFKLGPGNTRFIDRLKSLETLAHNLHFDLRADFYEEK